MTRFCRSALLLATVSLSGFFLGCETNGWLIDPQRTGYFQTTPTSIPILDRIDVIEQARDTSVVRRKPNSEDMIPKAVPYELSPGDLIRVTIPRLIPEQNNEREYSIAADGNIDLPVVRTIRAAGKTIRQLEDDIKLKLSGYIINATVSIQAVQAQGFQYRVLGSVEQPGVYGLTKPDLRLIDALATARGAAPTTTRVLVTRKPRANDAKYDIDFSESKEPSSTAPTAEPPATATPETASPAIAPASSAPAVAPVAGSEVDDLIGQLENQAGAAAPSSSTQPGSATPDTPPSQPAPQTTPASEPSAGSAAPSDPASEPAAQRPATSPGMLSSTGRQEPPVDIDTLESAKAKDAAAATQPQVAPVEGDRYTFDAASQSWVKVGQGAGQSSAASTAVEATPASTAGQPSTSAAAPAGLRTGSPARSKNDTKKAFDSEVIEIDYNLLVRGDANLNVIVKPGDMIFCDQGDVGVVYIDGLIARPGVYNLPTSGKLTLSRLVAAAGGLGELAIPQRVDLVRRLGEDKEACIRVNLAAIRNRSEPDIFMKPDDHVHIGTNFWATPLAVIRNGFRMTYGFGFLVDRNWGNDIFGAPPVNVVGN